MTPDPTSRSALALPARRLSLAALLLGAMLPACATPGAQPEPAATGAAVSADSAAVAGVVTAYHAALQAGDSLAALGLLAPDAHILESGGIESLAEYRAHHLAADIEFARTVREERSAVGVRVRGDAAWASSTSSAKGQFRGREIDSLSAELMVLVRTTDGWRIAAIHWSSRRRA